MRKDQKIMSTEAMQKQQKSWTQTPPSNPPLRHAIARVAEEQTWIDSLAKPFQKWVLQLFGQPDEPRRKLKDALNGTWLGHALHPLFTDVPLGSWSGTLLLDLLWLADEDEGMARGADTTLGLGLLGAMAAALTGVADWSDLYDTDMRVGFLHGLLNGSATLAYLTSWLLRRSGRRRAGIAVSTVGYLTALFSAYLGGELVFAKGSGVNHTAFESGSDEYVAVMAANDLVEGKLTRVEVAGIPAVLLKQGSTIYAIGATCTHQGGPLDEGSLKEGEIVECPWHGSRFHLCDGSVVNGPAVYAQPRFAVRVRERTVELRRVDHA
jgi:nitrite reductase/ring-hydroxylating ferredoxin subunit/uncharacterized membrane protein